AALVNITRAQLLQLGQPWVTIFSAAELLAGDELERAFGTQPSAPGLGRFFYPSWPFPALTEFQVKVLRALIHPQALIAKPATLSASSGPAVEVPAAMMPPATRMLAMVTAAAGGGAAAATEVEDVAVEVVPARRPMYRSTGLLELKVLDAQQEVAARRVGAGHRLVFGAAGTGKSAVVIAQARLLAQAAGRRVLVLCVSVPLASYLEQALRGQSELITVRHFDELAREYSVVRRVCPAVESHDELGRRLLGRLQSAPPASPYDAVLVDEAQDFHPSWFQCARRLLKDPDHGDLLIVGDGNQGVCGRHRIPWSSLGISARGRTTYLRKNYRNAREIVEFAAPFARTEYREDDGVALVGIEPGQVTRSSGVPPVVIKAGDRTDECGQAVDLIAGLLRGKFGERPLQDPVPPSDIGVLVPAVPDVLAESFAQFRRDLWIKGIPFVWMSNRKDQVARTQLSERGVKLLNVFHAKGLQFRAVVFFWADILPQERWLDRSREEQETLFYVALTRAEDYLAVIHSGDSEFVRRLVHSRDSCD
ncbi:MAG: AAA family ATPase, partial [Verrucomicrobia bacterium]|nr:AAA family ATPase [Verrucomicrobiota bacterium]